MARPPYVNLPVRFPILREDPRRVLAKDLVASVLAEVSSGRMPAGSRLPPVRVLEQQLGLSKNTAQAAYDELVARGVLEAREREGHFVAAHEGAADANPAALRFTAPAPKLTPAPALTAARLPPGAIALSMVFVDPALLPRERLAECARSVLRSPGLDAFYDPQGYGPLRELIAARLRARGMSEVTAANVLVTTGSQQALDCIARTLAVRRVAVESPVYAGAKLLFEQHGLQVTGLRLDPFRGLPLDEWAHAFERSRPALLYAITSYQNPTGYSYTSHEMGRVLELCERYGVALAEDDWGSDMLSGGEYRPMMRLLGGPNVLYVNAFTKKLLPSLRVGFLVACEEAMPTLLAAKRLSTLGNAWIAEATVAEFLDRGYYDTHLATLQKELDRRYTRCLELLRTLMPEGVRWTTPGGGPTLWLEVPREVDLDAVRARLAEHQVVVETAANAFHGEPHLHGFRVSYAFLPPPVLEHALGLLARELARALEAAQGPSSRTLGTR